MDYDKKLNDDVSKWRKDTESKLKESMDAAGIKHSDKSKSPVAARDALKSAQAKKFGVVNRISFKFPRHLVFVEKGVGRGHPISNPREAKPWFNKIVEDQMESLADIVAENTADKVVSDSFERMKIK